MSDRSDVLLERAITLICDEWGYTRARARAWLEDDTAEWDNSERPETTTAPGTFIQTRRTSVFSLPRPEEP